MVKESMDGDLLEQKAWYNLKYDRQILMPIEGDMEVMMSNGNDGHGYLYVDDNDGPRRQVQKDAAAWEGRTHTSNDGMVCGTSRRDGDVTAQEGRNGDANEGAVKRWILFKVLFNGMDQFINVMKLRDLCGDVLEIADQWSIKGLEVEMSNLNLGQD